MRMRNIALTLVTSLAGCATTNQIKLPPNPITVADFVQQIKYEVGKFDQEKNALPQLATRCGKALEFTTEKVGVTLAIVLKNTTEASFGAEIPLGTGSIGPEISANRALTGSQTIAFTVYPKSISSPSAVAPPSDKFEGTPIADALMAVYGGLRANSGYEPCVTFGTSDDQDNSIEYGFKVENSRTLGGKVKLFIFSLGASKARELAYDNTIKVNFKLSGAAMTYQ